MITATGLFKPKPFMFSSYFKGYCWHFIKL
jgi:hypothetical protein